jgi:hypothetical protein
VGYPKNFYERILKNRGKSRLNWAAGGLRPGLFQGLPKPQKQKGLGAFRDLKTFQQTGAEILQGHGQEKRLGAQLHLAQSQLNPGQPAPRVEITFAVPGFARNEQKSRRLNAVALAQKSLAGDFLNFPMTPEKAHKGKTGFR